MATRVVYGYRAFMILRLILILWALLAFIALVVRS
jgi:uncharacterized membrane protein